MKSPLFVRSTLLPILLAAAAAVQAGERSEPGPADAAQAEPAGERPATFRFARGLAAPGEAAGRHQENGVHLRHILARVSAVEPGEAAPRRERPYGGACNFTTSCR